jgi:iron-sulfur cluster assembly protein
MPDQESVLIRITPAAAAHIERMLSRRAAGETGLRIGVKAGGCSGFEYIFGWEQAQKETDQVFEAANGAKVFVDPRSLRLLGGTVVDYDTSLLSKGFLLNNPNATATCGCGVSFSVGEENRGSRS